MAAPITSKPSYVDRNLIDGPGSYYVRKDRTKQVKPYNLPAPYYRANVFTDAGRLQRYTSYGGNANASSNKGWPLIGPDTGDDPNTGRAMAINLARDKFVSEVREEAMLAVNYAERHQAMSMIANRANQLRRFTTAIRSFRIGDAIHALGLPEETTIARLKQKSRLRPGVRNPDRAKYSHSKSVANTFLEFHFGWEPLFHDVWTAMHLLSQPVAWPKVKSVGKKVTWDVYQVFGKSGTIGVGNWSLSEGQSTGKVRASVGGDIFVSNPNLWLLNQLGLLNPASFAWERVPFSFVADWIFNLNSYLAQWTDFSGLTLQNTWYNVRTSCPSATFHYREQYGSGFWEQYAVQSGTWSRRTLGIPGVTLGKLPQKKISATRAMTAMSLLVQRLPGKWDGLKTDFSNPSYRRT